jgi:hypothetical protein
LEHCNLSVVLLQSAKSAKKEYIKKALVLRHVNSPPNPIAFSLKTELVISSLTLSGIGRETERRKSAKKEGRKKI